MGNLWTSYLGKREERIIIIGLDSAGKTTMLYKLKLGTVITTIPTIGFNVETVQFLNINLTMWDMGSRDKLRPLWRHYYQGTSAIVFVLDSNDRERLEEAKDEFHRIMQEVDLRDVSALILANKQDIRGAMSVQEIEDSFQLHKIPHTTNIFGVCATSGQGLQESFEWLTTALQSKTTGQKYKSHQPTATAKALKENNSKMDLLLPNWIKALFT